MRKLILRSRSSATLRVLQGWMLFVALCLTYAAIAWSIQSAVIRMTSVEADREQHRIELTNRMQRYVLGHLEDLQASITNGKSIPVEHYDDTDRIMFDGSAVDPRFAGFGVDMIFKGDGIGSYVRVVPPVDHHDSFRDWLGSADVQVGAERFGKSMMVLCAMAWAAIAVMIPLAGPYRRRLAQLMIAAALLALVGWLADPLRPALWSIPTFDWIPASAATGLFIGLLALLVPARKPQSRLNRCLTCGYDLTGNVSGICPECGEPTPTEVRRRHDAELTPLADAIAQVRLNAAQLSPGEEEGDGDAQHSDEPYQSPEVKHPIPIWAEFMQHVQK
jgi:hypothetical protein